MTRTTTTTAVDDARRLRSTPGETESGYAWFRLGTTLLLSTIGGVGMWSVVVALPAVQADFHVARASASFPYTLTMLLSLIHI